MHKPKNMEKRIADQLSELSKDVTTPIGVVYGTPDECNHSTVLNGLELFMRRQFSDKGETPVIALVNGELIFTSFEEYEQAKQEVIESRDVFDSMLTVGHDAWIKEVDRLRAEQDKVEDGNFGDQPF